MARECARDRRGTQGRDSFTGECQLLAHRSTLSRCVWNRSPLPDILIIAESRRCFQCGHWRRFGFELKRSRVEDPPGCLDPKSSNLEPSTFHPQIAQMDTEKNRLAVPLFVVICVICAIWGRTSSVDQSDPCEHCSLRSMNRNALPRRSLWSNNYVFALRRLFRATSRTPKGEARASNT